jgi:ubiquitin-protein ligase
MASITASLL